MKNKRKLIFFDFDGVIADSFSAAFGVNKMMSPSVSEDDYRKRFDGNINESAANVPAKEEPRTDIDFFREYRPLLLKSRIFPDVPEVIKKLAGEFTLVIVSSTITNLIAEYLELHDIEQCFSEIMGNDVHTSKIKKIEMAMEKYEIASGDCWFVTDTLGDIKEAHHAGVKTIAVT
ncbi:MAG TPA: HAD hydrolase-like protein [Candidatus Paceibacterota bacterium]|nr:HAD hydrolase-like protein [Candidatus Paceibacterota bacterium]